MIQPMERSSRVPTARVVCDECGKDEVVTCDYERSGANWLVNEGQATRKVTAHGWDYVKGKHHCPACRARRKAPDDSTKSEDSGMAKPAVVSMLREPSKEQKRQIISLLEVSYDTASGRYKGADTDKTVADAIGGGCMPGWVGNLREEFFGPDGGNAEIEAVLAAIGAAQKSHSEALAKIRSDAEQSIKKAEEAFRSELKRLRSRVEAIKAAVGPKAERA